VFFFFLVLGLLEELLFFLFYWKEGKSLNWIIISVALGLGVPYVIQ
jgi:hypothetical protein